MFNCFWLVCTLYGSTRFVFVYWPWFRFLYVLGGYKPRISRTSCIAVHSSTFGDRSFAVAGARIWNSLPSSLRSADLFTERFKRALKTFLFETVARL